MTRRRLTRWGRQALEVCEAAGEELTPDTPVVFSSRHGDTARTYKLLAALAEGQPLSPNGFSLSVHNSALGIFSILRQITAPGIALAAGRDTFAAAWCEALSWLDQGAPQVLLVHTDEPLQGVYRPFADEQEMPAAVALLLAPEQADAGRRVSLRMQPVQQEPSEHSLMISFLHWWYSGAESLEVSTDQHTWQWRRDADPV
ncbi:beta-ketoacyl synthase chain length factor [Gilvimarinus sp. DA14]|nr:beta-ketoacyl synthase chain length factor [Gilvimarinus sp. DA14]